MRFNFFRHKPPAPLSPIDQAIAAARDLLAIYNPSDNYPTDLGFIGHSLDIVIEITAEYTDERQKKETQNLDIVKALIKDKLGETTTNAAANAFIAELLTPEHAVRQKHASLIVPFLLYFCTHFDVGNYFMQSRLNALGLKYVML